MSAFQKYMQTLDRQADEAEDRNGFWEAVSLLLVIWSSGGIPAPAYDPRIHREFTPLFNAFKKFGSNLRVAVDARAFPI